jgi:hypothetical protein
MDDAYELEFKTAKGMGNILLDIRVKGGRMYNFTMDASTFRSKWTLEMAIERVSRTGYNQMASW